MNPERWKAVPGFEGLYSVSEHGNVFRLGRVVTRAGSDMKIAGRPLSGSRDRDGRHRIRLRKDGQYHAHTVGELVLFAFVGPRPAGMECCHGRRGASDDRVDNLRWDTHAANMADQNCDGTFSPPPVRLGEQNNRAVLTVDDVRVIRAEPDYPRVCIILGERFGILSTSVGNIRRGLSWKHVA